MSDAVVVIVPVVTTFDAAGATIPPATSTGDVAARPEYSTTCAPIDNELCVIVTLSISVAGTCA